MGKVTGEPDGEKVLRSFRRLSHNAFLREAPTVLLFADRLRRSLEFEFEFEFESAPISYKAAIRQRRHSSSLPLVSFSQSL